MTLYDVLPWIAAAAFVATTAVIAVAPSGGPGRRRWLIPALLCGAFLGWSGFAVATGGVTGFWGEHVRNVWGNQIWFDLLIGIGVGWTMLAPKARAAGMRPLPWLALIVVSGGIGLLAMLARYLYLRDRRPAATLGSVPT